MASRIGLRDIRALGANKEIWDTDPRGFGARRQSSDAVTYVLMYRNTAGKQRRFTIGRHGAPWTPDTARIEAKRLIGLVVSGQDPAEVKREARQAVNVGELCDMYMQAAEAGRLLTRQGRAKKASTLGIDRLRISVHIKPILGEKSIRGVTRNEVEDFMHRVAAGDTVPPVRGKSRAMGGRGTASRTIGLLGAIFGFAVRKDLRSDNPVRGIQRFADGRRDRRLEDEEYTQLGAVLRRSENRVWPAAIAVARFLALTGWRRGEALNLQWSDLSIQRRTANLPDTKTGRSIRPLSTAACGVLGSLPRSGHYVFPAMRCDQPMRSFQNIFAALIKDSGMPTEITPHTLRHSFASVASDLGYSEATVGTLIGHKGQTMTSRYTHSADAVVLAAADAVADRISGLMDGHHGRA